MVESGRLKEEAIPDDYHWLVRMLDGVPRSTTDPAYVEAARLLHEGDGVHIEAGAVVSLTEEGAHVEAWVWVDAAEVENYERAIALAEKDDE